MESWDKLDNISLLLKTKSKVDFEREFMHNNETSYGVPQKRRVRIILKNANDGRQFVLERIIRRQIEEREKRRHDVSPIRNKMYVRGPCEKRKTRPQRGSNKKRSSSPKRKSKRQQFKRVSEEEIDQHSSSRSRQSSTGRSNSPTPTGHPSKNNDCLRNLLKTLATNRNENDKWHQLDVQQNPLFRNHVDDDRWTEPGYGITQKEVKYVRMSALSPKCFARQNLSHAHGLYEVDGYFCDQFSKTSRLPTINGSENGENSVREDAGLAMPPSSKPEVVHYTDGYRVGSIEVFEPIYILNSLCKVIIIHVDIQIFIYKSNQYQRRYGH